MGDPTIILEPESFSSTTFADSLFFKQAIDLKYVSSQYHSFSPTNSLTNATQVDILLPQFQSASIYDLKNSYLEVGFKIVDEEGNLPSTNTIIGPVNNILHSMFKNVEVFFNDTRITTASGHHAYKEFLKNYVSYSNDFKNTVLRPSGWAEDPASHRNTFTALNTGFWKRLAMLAQCEPMATNIKKFYEDGCTVIGRLGLDVEDAGPLINGVTVRISYYLSDPEFFLMGAEKSGSSGVLKVPTKKYTFKIHKFVVHALVHDLSPSLYQTLESKLSKQSAIMAYKRYQIVPFTISQGLSQWLSDSLLPSQSLVPNRMYFVLISSQLYEPNISNNPYQFGLPYNSPCEVTSFEITINGNLLDGLTSSGDFKKMAYFKFHKFTGMLNSGNTNSITPEEFFNGGTVYVADFSTALDSTSDYVIPSLKSGYIRLSISFKSPLTSSYHLLAMSEFNSTLSIANSKNGRVISSNFFL